MLQEAFQSGNGGANYAQHAGSQAFQELDTSHDVMSLFQVSPSLQV
jgi:hypothetical protein